MPSTRIALLLALTLLAAPAVQSQQQAGIRGFTAAGAAAERDAEKQFQAIPKPDNLRDYMREISAEPHHAGSPGSRRVAEFVLAKFKSWGLNAAIEQQEALMPYPTERVVELVSPEQYTAKLKEPGVEADKDSTDADQLPTFNAYSADGDVTADLVYVNYGIPEDYEQLAELGIDVKGKIVIARYGESWRGIKPKVACGARRGRLHHLLGSRATMGTSQGMFIPTGPVASRTGRAARQRHGHADLPWRSADARHGARNGRTPAVDARTPRPILKIPVLPISYGDALPLLRDA